MLRLFDRLILACIDLAQRMNVISPERRDVYLQLGRYFIAGGLSVAVDMLAFAAFRYALVGQGQSAAFSAFFPKSASPETVVLGTAAFFGEVIAIVFNYYISRGWVFQPGRHRQSFEFILFVGVTAVVATLSAVVTILIKDWLAPSTPEEWQAYLDYVARFLAICVTFVFNFIGKKFLVFKG